MTTTADPQPNSTMRVRIICSHCDRVVTRNSRKGYTVRCPHCGTVNAGPALVAEQGKPKAEGARRRVNRRDRAAEQRAEREAGESRALTGTGNQPGGGRSAPPPAPVRRKRTASPSSAAPAPAEPARDGQQPAAPKGGPSHTPSPPRRGGVLAALERLTWGGEE